MRDFFLKWRFFILFILLESTALFLSFSKNNFHQNIDTGSSNFIIGNIYKSIYRLRRYFFLDIENEKLINENAKLRHFIISSKIKKITKDFKKKNIDYLQQYIYTPVKIINNSIYEQENYITINKGSLDGIKTDMGIILSYGIAGIIIKTSPHFSIAISLLNPKIKVNARLKKNKYFGTVSWDGLDHEYIVLYDIPRHSIFYKGEIVETDGKSSTFPEGIPIGRVTCYKFDEKYANYVIKVKLFENFSTLENAYVVKNLFKKEWNNIQLYKVEHEQ
ncbi:rod shape-determining protein MreC [Blattabacterium sp. (Cryptocercus punctulatus) str. Cpu]|uniref:rod shape-determining protein MreC n=1 Tax=Blattabacterium sp. (Cryptocercus punctulatus) str. Cpu TaxID=1075399 RepID=UPI00023871DA|nr:rod shape-determining protein MreC [Blattabacterium sp. (Cryptocercus punctulatus) str. Cpu]AEU09074.1 rod shape-determining protein MreC [Blattabacterium sp. (Cryptocercus punctulatus) str. Cpu]